MSQRKDRHFIVLTMAMTFMAFGCAKRQSQASSGSSASPASDTGSVELDTTAPVAPVIVAPASSPWTSQTGLDLVGICEDGANVVLSGDDSQSQSCSGGAFHFSIVETVDGTYGYSLTQIDSAGNPSPVSPFSWTLDTTAPAPVTIASPASDPYVSSGGFTLSGSCEAQSTVTLSGDDLQTQACPTGTFSFLITQSIDGAYTYSIEQADIAGNSSAVVSIQWIRDSSLPPTPTLTSPSANPLTSNATIVAIAGTCENGNTVQLSGDSIQSTNCASAAFSFSVSETTDGTYGYAISQTDGAANSSASVSLSWNRDTVAPTAPSLNSPSANPLTSNATNVSLAGGCETGATVLLSGSDTQSTTCNSGSYAFSISKSSDGNYSFAIRQRDPANNLSAPTSFAWTRDTAVPSAPTITTPSISPSITNTSALTIAGACESGATVNLTGASTQSTLCSSGTYSLSVGASLDATYAYTLRQTDPAGNASAAATQNWVRDTGVPAAPVITTPAVSPYTSSSGLTLSGTCEANATINLSGDETQSQSCNSGAFSFVISESADGSFSYSVRQTDAAGNISTSSTQNWNRDSMAPVAPTITTPTENPLVSGDTSISIAGSCETGSTVFLSGDSSGSTSCTGSAYGFSVAKTADGTYSFLVYQTDGSGNSSGTAALTWIRDTTIPPSPVITSPASSTVVNSNSTLAISGNCETGDTVHLVGASTQSTTCVGAAFSFTVTATSDGTYSYSLSQENTAGAVSSAVSQTWIRDTAAPAAPTIASPTSNPYVSSGTMTVTGGCEGSATVTIFGSSTHTGTCATNGTYSINVTETVDGAYTYSVEQTDIVGNTSIATGPIQWTRDSSVPPTPIILVPAASPLVSSTTSFSVSGTCTDGYLVSVFGDDTSSQICASSAFSFLISESTDGTYTHSIAQRNLSGIDSGSASVQWIRDTISPTVTLSSTPPSTNLLLTATFAFTLSEASTSECSIDSGAWTSCSSPITLSGLTTGNHSFQVRATDTAANVGFSSTYAWFQGAYNTVALYHLDSGSLSTDSSLYTTPNNNAFTVSSGVTTGSGAGAAFGQGANFSGNGILSVPDSGSFDTISGKLTAEAFVKFNALPTGTYTLMGQYGSSGAYGWELGVKRQGGSNYRFTFTGSTNGTSVVTVNSSNVSLNTTSFYHVAVTFNSGTVKIYLNGAQVASGTIGTVGTATLFNPSTLFRVGQNASAANKLNGVLDEIRISQTVRYNAPFSASVPTGPFTAD